MSESIAQQLGPNWKPSGDGAVYGRYCVTPHMGRYRCTYTKGSKSWEGFGATPRESLADCYDRLVKFSENVSADFQRVFGEMAGVAP